MKAHQMNIVPSSHWGVRFSTSRKTKRFVEIHPIFRLSRLIWILRFKTARKRNSFLYHINKIL